MKWTADTRKTETLAAVETFKGTLQATPGYKQNFWYLWVFSRWHRNFCVCSIPWPVPRDTTLLERAVLEREKKNWTEKILLQDINGERKLLTKNKLGNNTLVRGLF